MDESANPLIGALSMLANDRKTYTVMQRSREIFGPSKPVVVEKKDFVSALQQGCDEDNQAHVDRLTRGLFDRFLPNVFYCLSELHLTSAVVHSAAEMDLKLDWAGNWRDNDKFDEKKKNENKKILEPLGTLQTIHIVICSEECFAFVDTLSRASPNVSTLILECAKNPCSGCIPHEMDDFWAAMHWKPAHLRRFALVGFGPDEAEWWDEPPSYICDTCRDGVRVNVMNNKLCRFGNLQALDLRMACAEKLLTAPLEQCFPRLAELRLGLVDYHSHLLLDDIADCSRLEFLELTDELFGDGLSFINDTEFLPGLQRFTLLTHLHLQLNAKFLLDYEMELFDYCEGLASFFRNPEISLKNVYIELKYVNIVLVNDLIEGNLELETLVVSAELYDTEEHGVEAAFASLGRLAKLRIFYVGIRDVAELGVFGRPASLTAPAFFDVLHPVSHPDLQVAAIDFEGSRPSGFLELVLRVQWRFDGTGVNIFGYSSSRRVRTSRHESEPADQPDNGLPMANRQRRLADVLRRVSEISPRFLCCFERLFVGSVSYDWHFPWKYCK